MGLQVDLVQMFGPKYVPAKFKCVKCSKTFETLFSDFDLECGNPNPAPGRWVLPLCCPYCDDGVELRFQVGVETLFYQTPEKKV
jgi:hypothetical protein